MTKLSRRQSLKRAAAGAAAAGGVAVLGPEAALAAGTSPFIVVDQSGGGDYTSIEDAVASAPAGSMIFVKRGTHTVVNGEMDPAEGVLITGEGFGTRIRAKDGLNTNVFQIAHERVVLDNLTVDGNAANQAPGSSQCVAFTADNCEVVDCFVQDAAGAAIAGFGVSGLIVRGNYIFAGSAARPHWGVYLDGGNHCSVVNNTIAGCTHNGVHVENASHHNTVTGNTARDCGYSGIQVENGPYDNSFTANACFGNYFGIRIESARGNVVAANSVGRSLKSGIHLDSGTESVVADNSARDNRLDGIRIFASGGSAITGNMTSLNDRAGILLEDSSDCVCDGNVSMNNGRQTSSPNLRAGIGVSRSGGSCANNVVTNNRCLDTQATKTQEYGIAVLNGATNTLLSGNMLVGNRSTSGALLVSASSLPGTYSTPYRRLTVTVGTAKQAIPHGLPYTPTFVAITMTSAGTIWRAGDSGSNIYLQADAAGRTAEVLVG